MSIFQQYIRGYSNKGGAFVASFCIFFLMMPYFFWSKTFNNPQVLTLVTALMGFLFLRNADRRKGNVPLLIFFLAIIISYTMINGYNLIFSLSFIPLGFLPFGSKDFQTRVYNNFLLIYCSVVAISLMFWLLAVVGVIQPLGTIQPLNQLKLDNYNVYPFTVISQEVGSFAFGGPFDERGVIGTASGILLIIQQFNFKEKINYVLLLSGLCSFSFFFYGLMFIYILLSFCLVEKDAKKTFYFILFTVVVIVAIFNVPMLYESLGSRFEWDSSRGTFSGDNRLAEAGKDYFESIVGTSEFWFGISNKEAYRDLTEGSSSYINVIVINGMLFFASYMSFYILYGLQRKTSNMQYFLFLFVVFATIYQRPFLFDASFIFMWSYLAGINPIKHSIYGVKS